MPILNNDGVSLRLTDIETVRGAGFLQRVGAIRKVGHLELAALRILILPRVSCLGSRIGNSADHRLVIEHCILHRGTTGTILHVCPGHRAAGGDCFFLEIIPRLHNLNILTRKGKHIVIRGGVLILIGQIEPFSIAKIELVICCNRTLRQLETHIVTARAGTLYITAPVIAVRALLIFQPVFVPRHIRLLEVHRDHWLRHLDLHSGCVLVTLFGGGDDHIA